MKKENVFKALSSHLKQEWTENLIPTRLQQQLDELEEEAMQCRKCPLYKTAQHLVFSDGDPEKGIVVIGEAPGADEDRTGRPFVGRAGQLLTRTIEKLGYKRSDVYICNILKHRPPNNRNPQPDEISACTPFLIRQLELIKPAVIVTLGNYSTKFILDTETGITKIRGRLHTSPAGYKVLPTLHPAAVLRNMNRLADFESDLALAFQQKRSSDPSDETQEAPAIHQSGEK